MTATALEISCLDPIIPDQEIYLFQPGHIDMKVGEKRSGAWPSFPHFMMAHSISPFFRACNIIVSTSLNIIIYEVPGSKPRGIKAEFRRSQPASAFATRHSAAPARRRFALMSYGAVHLVIHPWSRL
jgi:hypothetical protein